MNRMIKYTLMPVVAAASLLVGCDSHADGPGGRDGGTDAVSDVAIAFAAASQSRGMKTRAVEDFPNTSIGVSATYDGYLDDWRYYRDIMNERATVSDEDAGVFGFSWVNTKYWPLDGTALIFAAYSPHTSDAPGVLSLNYDLVHLDINLADDMPDVMYASDNGTDSFNKADTTALLGEFRHALSQLTVVVEADAGMNPEVQIGSLSVVTSKGKATLDLITDGELDFGGGRNFTYNLVSSATPFVNAPFTETVFLFPDTQDDVRIVLGLKDSTYDFDVEYVLSEVDFDAPASGKLNLVRAANTTLTITVSGTPVEQPGGGIHLQGQLTDWIDKGDLLVTIN